MSLQNYLNYPVSAGGRNHALFVATMFAREEGYSESELIPLLKNKALADGLGEAEIYNTIQSAMRKPIEARQSGDYDWHTKIGASKEHLTWESRINEERPLLPERPHIPQPAEDFATGDLARFLNVLFQPDEIVSYVVTYKADDSGSCKPNGRGVYVRTADEIIEEVSKGDTAERLHIKDECGAWIRLNPMDGKGIHDRNVIDYRHALVEADGPPIEMQWSIINKLKLPCAAVVHSGGKSLHASVKIQAHDAKEYAIRVAKLYAILEANGLKIDTQNKNPSRLSRLPGCTRKGNPQYILATNIGCDSWDSWVKYIEEQMHGVPRPESWAELRLNPPPLNPEIIHGILRRGHKMLLGGPSKAGKSYALIQLAAAVCSGGLWMDTYRCAEGNVLYVNLEIDRASFVQRVATVESQMPFNAERLTIWNLRGHNMSLTKMRQSMQNIMEGKQFDFIILDPIYKMNSGDENSAQDMTLFCNLIESIAESTGAAVGFAHHFSKGQQGGKASIDRSSGSGVFGRDPDAIGTLSELEGEDVRGCAYLLEWTLREFRSPEPVELLWEWPLHKIEPLLKGRKVAGSVGRPKTITQFEIASLLPTLQDKTVQGVASAVNKSIRTIRNVVSESQILYIDNGIIYVK